MLIRIQEVSHNADQKHCRPHLAPTTHLEPGFDGLERPTALLHGPGQAGHVVVGERGHVELQHLHILWEDVGRRTGLLIPYQLVVGLKLKTENKKNINIKLQKKFCHEPHRDLVHINLYRCCKSGSEPFSRIQNYLFRIRQEWKSR